MSPPSCHTSLIAYHCRQQVFEASQLSGPSFPVKACNKNRWCKWLKKTGEEEVASSAQKLAKPALTAEPSATLDHISDGVHHITIWMVTEHIPSQDAWTIPLVHCEVASTPTPKKNKQGGMLSEPAQSTSGLGTSGLGRFVMNTCPNFKPGIGLAGPGQWLPALLFETHWARYLLHQPHPSMLLW